MTGWLIEHDYISTFRTLLGALLTLNNLNPTILYCRTSPSPSRTLWLTLEYLGEHKSRELESGCAERPGRWFWAYSSLVPQLGAAAVVDPYPLTLSKFCRSTVLWRRWGRPLRLPRRSSAGSKAQSPVWKLHPQRSLWHTRPRSCGPSRRCLRSPVPVHTPPSPGSPGAPPPTPAGPGTTIQANTLTSTLEAYSGSGIVGWRGKWMGNDKNK